MPIHEAIVRPLGPLTLGSLVQVQAGQTPGAPSRDVVRCRPTAIFHSLARCRRGSSPICSYADAAALILGSLTPGGEMSRHRVGLALPVGMRGKKAQWAARPSAAQQRDTLNAQAVGGHAA